MCIIAAKPAGVAMPGETTIRNMWDGNPDGAGYMYADGGKVHIEKGFMQYEAFAESLRKLGERYDLTKLPMVLHFRITTHGGTKPENTHPFPVTDSIGALKKLRSVTNLGVAHNGIIPIQPRTGISDTMEYIASQLAPLHRALPRFYENRHAMQMVENATTSKLAFLTGRGKIFTIGHFLEEEGILYSNDSYLGWWPRWRKFSGCFAETDGWRIWDEDATRLLMWLDETHLVRLPDGELQSGDEYLIGEDAAVWWYDWDSDTAFRLPGATALTDQMTPVRFDPRNAERIVVFDPDDDDPPDETGW